MEIGEEVSTVRREGKVEIVLHMDTPDWKIEGISSTAPERMAGLGEEEGEEVVEEREVEVRES